MTKFTEAEVHATTDDLYEWLTRYVNVEGSAELRRTTYPILEEAYRQFRRMWEGVREDPDPEAALTAWKAATAPPNTTRITHHLFNDSLQRRLGSPAAEKPNMVNALSMDFFVNLTLDQLLEYERVSRKIK